MTAISSFASHLIAGSAALALSLVLISGTVTTPAAQNAEMAAATTEILA